MAQKCLRDITLTIFDQEHVRKDWFFDFSGESFKVFLNSISREMRKLGIKVECVHNHDTVIVIRSYSDLLNCVKVSSDDNPGNHCIGHIIGKSEHLDILEDIGTAIRRIAFAPETIAPAGEFRKVCHNCGCGC
jgi:hypothetical protein